MRASVLFLLFLFCGSLVAQEKFTLSGYVKDASNGETLIGANVFVSDDRSTGTSSNNYGFYSLTLPAGDYVIESSYLGFQAQKFSLSLYADQSFNIELSPAGFLLEQEVVVTAERKDENVNSAAMGTVEMSVDKIKSLPAFLGEVDIIKTIQLLPGVMSAGEGNSGFYVRGGGPDQNLILLDEAVVYNTGHMFGFFSVFNSDALKNTTLIKGGMPANYGGRLSSVLDVTMKEGNDRRFQVDGGLGIVSSRLTLQGPIKKEQTSFIISGRRTYLFDLLKPAIDDTDFAGTNYYFYDLNAKINHRFSEKDRLFVSGYFGRDVLVYNNDARNSTLRIPWGNSTGTVRWNHLFTDKLFMNVSAVYNDYNFEFEGKQDDFSFKLNSGIRDYNGKVDFDWYPNVKHSVKAGANYTFHKFTPNSASGQSGDTSFEPIGDSQFAHEASIYVLDDFDLSPSIKINVGLRAALFQQVGPFESIRGTGLVTDTTTYAAGEEIVTYTNLEPRINVRFKLSESASIKAGYSRNNQFIHLITNSGSTLPTDLWVPSSQIVRPQIGDQYSLGFFKNLWDNEYEASVEVYYKDLQNQIEYTESYVPELGTPLENSFVFGTAEAYGAEFFLKKTQGDFNGWIGYTLSRTDRKFPDLNGGRVFPAKFDRRHDLSVAANYTFNDTWTFGSVLVYGSGNALTVPVGFFLIEDHIGQQFSDRNSYRIKPYSRLDLSATRKNKKKLFKGKVDSELVFSVYNALNRKNVYYIFTESTFDFENQTIENKAFELTLFPIIPSVSFNFSF